MKKLPFETKAIYSDKSIINHICKLALENTESDQHELRKYIRNNLIDINTKVDDLSAVKWLALNGEFKAAENLITNHQANKNDAIEGATFANHLQFLHQLLEINNIENINSAAIGAAKANNEELTFKFINDGADINRSLEAAAEYDHRELTLKLLDRPKADIHVAGFGAAHGGQKNLTLELVQKGADLKECLRGAASAGHSKLTTDLIDMGGDINAATYLAMKNGNFNIVNQLIKRGASPDVIIKGARDAGYANHNHTLLRYCASIDDKKIRKLLINEAKSLSNAFDEDKLSDEAKFLNSLMRRGLDYEEARESRWSVSIERSSKNVTDSLRSKEYEIWLAESAIFATLCAIASPLVLAEKIKDKVKSTFSHHKKTESHNGVDNDTDHHQIIGENKNKFVAPKTLNEKLSPNEDDKSRCEWIENKGNAAKVSVTNFSSIRNPINQGTSNAMTSTNEAKPAWQCTR